jgi:hypothetical protein
MVGMKTIWNLKQSNMTGAFPLPAVCMVSFASKEINAHHVLLPLLVARNS